jgi:hypothetical protein
MIPYVYEYYRVHQTRFSKLKNYAETIDKKEMLFYDKLRYQIITSQRESSSPHYSLDLEIVFFKDNERIVEYYSDYMKNKDKKIDEMLSQIGTSTKKDKDWFLKKMKTWGEKGDISTLGIG